MARLVRFLERIHDGEVLLLDGAIGTELQRRGAPMDSTAWCGLATQSHPEMLRQIHIDYITAGADIITTNTFATGRHVLEPLGLGDEAETLDRMSVAIARQAIEASAEKEVLIAGSMSSMGPLDRSRSTPRGDAAEISYRKQAETLAEAGVDVLVLEMLRDIANASLVIEAATGVGLPVLVGWSASSDETGDVVPHRSNPYREYEARSFNELTRLGAKMGGDVAGIMHSAVELTGPALEILNRHWAGPTMAYAETGRFEPPNWVFTEATAPEGYAAAAREWIEAGVQVIGGCCGTTPSHATAIRSVMDTVAPSNHIED